MTDLNERITSALVDAAKGAHIFFSNHAALEKCQSPLETLMLYTFWAEYGWFMKGKIELCETLDDFQAACTGRRYLNIAPQVAVGPYRADFLVGLTRFGSEPPAIAAIECDGHDFQ